MDLGRHDREILHARLYVSQECDKRTYVVGESNECHRTMLLDQRSDNTTRAALTRPTDVVAALNQERMPLAFPLL